MIFAFVKTRFHVKLKRIPDVRLRVFDRVFRQKIAFNRQPFKLRFETAVFFQSRFDRNQITRTVRRFLKPEKIFADFTGRLGFGRGKFVRAKFADGAINRLSVAVKREGDRRKMGAGKLAQKVRPRKRAHRNSTDGVSTL